MNDGDTHNGPSEQVEAKYPLLVERYALRAGFRRRRALPRRARLRAGGAGAARHPLQLADGPGEVQAVGARRRIVRARQLGCGPPLRGERGAALPQRQGAQPGAARRRRLYPALRRRRRLRLAARARSRQPRARRSLRLRHQDRGRAGLRRGARGRLGPDRHRGDEARRAEMRRRGCRAISRSPIPACRRRTRMRIRMRMRMRH